MSPESMNLVFMLLSAMLYSFMGCFIKMASQNGAAIPSTELVFIRTLFQGSFVVMGLVWLTENDGTRMIQRPFGRGKVARLVLLRGGLGGLGIVLYFYSIEAVPLGDATTLFSLRPLWTIFLARAFLSENISQTSAIAVTFGFCGSVLIAGPSFFGSSDSDISPTNVNPLGYATALIGSLVGASVHAVVRSSGAMMKAGAHVLRLLFSWAIFGVICSLVFSSFGAGNHYQGAWQVPSAAASYYALGVCIFGSSAHFLFNYAGQRVPAGIGSITRSSDIMWAYLWQIIVFKQVPRLSTILGVLMILLSVLAIAIQKVQDETLRVEKEVKNDVGVTNEQTSLLQKEGSH